MSRIFIVLAVVALVALLVFGLWGWFDREPPDDPVVPSPAPEPASPIQYDNEPPVEELPDTSGPALYEICNYGAAEVGWYNWHIDEYGNYTEWIEIDTCALKSFGAGPYDYASVLEHEMEHAAGYSHEELGNYIEICGC